MLCRRGDRLDLAIDGYQPDAPHYGADDLAARHDDGPSFLEAQTPRPRKVAQTGSKPRT